MKIHFLLGLAAVSFAGCASAPPDHYFTLSVELPSAAAPPRAIAWRLAGVRLPGISDRPQLVVRTGPQTVRLLEFDKWAEPLDDLVPRILAQDLALRQGVQAANAPARRIYVVVDEFMADDRGSARLTGRWWTQPPEGEAAADQPRAFTFAASLASGEGAAAPAALSRLLGLLADDIARDGFAGAK
jgi:hypothetical protein